MDTDTNTMTPDSTATAPAIPTATATATVTPSSTPVPVKLAVILGSNREGRFAPVISEWFLARAAEHADFTTELVDLAETELPTGLSYNPGPTVRTELAKVTGPLADADAFVVLTPEYNHSFPATLKSLIDWHYAEWRAKPVGFVSYGGISGGLRAVEQLRQVFAELHAVTVRDTVSFHNAGELFDDTGRPKDPTRPDAAAKVMLDQLSWWGLALREAKAVRPYAG
jgi:NAD(P)H-dependent FMN reductase